MKHLIFDIFTFIDVDTLITFGSLEREKRCIMRNNRVTLENKAKLENKADNSMYVLCGVSLITA